MYKRKVDKMKDGHTERWRKKHNVGQKEREKPDSTNVEINREKMSLRRILVCCIKTCKKDCDKGKIQMLDFWHIFPVLQLYHVFASCLLKLFFVC